VKEGAVGAGGVRGSHALYMAKAHGFVGGQMDAGFAVLEKFLRQQETTRKRIEGVPRAVVQGL